MRADPVAEGIAGGWKTYDASQLNQDLELEADVAILGTGAGGGIAAEVLSQAGLKVVLVEEGPLKTSGDFTLEERQAYPDMYQESASRKTKDKAINVLQGKCVGGGTTVNWTSSFDTPEPTLRHWQEVYGVAECAPEEMAPWFAKVEERVHVMDWSVPPNKNNLALESGCKKLGWSFSHMRRNVNGCANLGYCGMGCPLNAKQSMLVTTIPAALQLGAVLVTRARAKRLVREQDRISLVECDALDGRGVFPTGRQVRVRARHYVVACGAIGSPALLLRSKLPDPLGLIGKRTFLHPVNATFAWMPELVEGFSGAPQTVYSDHFLWQDNPAGRMGYKIEVPPLHPMLVSTVIQGYGRDHSALMERFAYLQCMLSLNRDGFHEQSPGGTVALKDDGTPVLDYPLTDYVWEGMRRSFASMMELQFAAGAETVLPLHREVKQPYRSWKEAKTALAELALAAMRTLVFSAHVMGGCPMGEHVENSVVNSQGSFRQLSNLSVIDGSVFPTSIGTNPQVSVYGFSLKNATALARRLTDA